MGFSIAFRYRKFMIFYVRKLSYLKEKEIQQKITQDKQKEIFHKEIEVYQELYLMALNYTEQKHNIGLPIPNPTIIPNEKEYVLYGDVLNQIFNFIKENIFYLSDKLVLSYQQLFSLYQKELYLYDISRRENYHSSPDLEEEILYVEAQKRFYSQNKDKAKDFIEQIKDEYKIKKNLLIGTNK